MSETNQCPQCGAKLPASAPRGLCPACLLNRGLETNTAGFTAEESPRGRWTPPEVEELSARFPELEIARLIGRGGMGAVYQARQKNLDRVVALKILPPEMGRGPAEGGFAERFAREAQAMAKLNHPHIVTIHEFGERAGWYYFVMEYVDGVNLRGLLDSGHVAPREALAIVPQICEALQYAHDQGIVHRDIKPENILLNKQGQVKIADFGLAKLMGRTPLPPGEGGGVAPPGEGAPGSPEASTLANQVLGTPQYMAPEQLDRPAEVDHRADIYSLGVVFYQMLTGELPKGKFTPPSQKVQIDVRLDEVVLRALEREPEKRYQQVSEVKTMVETIVSSRTTSAPTATSNASPTGTATNKPQFIRIFEILSGDTFTSPLAIKLINISALGFLANLAFLGFVPLPGMQRCFGFSGFAGFFGLIGVAFIIEFAKRRKAKQEVAKTIALVTSLRWTARILGSLWAAMLLTFVLGEGSPALGAQSPSVQWAFAAEGLWLAGFIVGWWFEGIAAVLILLGSAVFHSVEGRFPLGWGLELPGVIGVIYALCWAMRHSIRKAPGSQPIAPSQPPTPATFCIRPVLRTLAWHAVLVLLAVAYLVRIVPHFGKIYRDFGMVEDHLPPLTQVIWAPFHSINILAVVLLFIPLLGLDVGICLLTSHLGRWAVRLWTALSTTLVVLLLAIITWALYIPVAHLVTSFLPPQPIRSSLAGVRSQYPKFVRIGRHNVTAYLVHDDVDLHYAIFYAGDFSSSSGGSHNKHSLTWIDGGSLKLKNGRTFGYLRESVNPFYLSVNGEEYDLRQGRVLVLHDDGTVAQIKLFPSLAAAQDVDTLAKLIAAAPAPPTQPAAKRQRCAPTEGMADKTSWGVVEDWHEQVRASPR